MTQRGISFTNIFNFRDLGGYSTSDGHTVRWRRLYRSDDLSRLADEDRDRFAGLGIRTVVDLRRPGELAEVGRFPQLDGITYHHVHLVHQPWPQQRFTDTTQRTSYLRERYRELTTEAADGIGETLRMLADADQAPLVFHCLAGKDRTGIVAALTLSLLGVPDDTVVEDYELSEKAEPASWAYFTRDQPSKQRDRWKHITVSPRQGMRVLLDDLRAHHGSIEGYAHSVGVTDEHIRAMRAHLLTPRSR